MSERSVYNPSEARRRTALRLGWHVLLGSAFVFIPAGAISAQSDPRYVQPLAWALFFAVVHYILFALIRSRVNAGVILLTKDEKAIDLAGWRTIGLTWGLVWRFVLILGISETLFITFGTYRSVETSTGLVLALIAAIVYSFGASAWLLSYQAGRTKILFPQEPSTQRNHNMTDRDDSVIEATKQGIGAIFGTAAVVSYFAIGLVQLAAVFTFFDDYWGWWTIPSVIVGLFVAYMPLVGNVAGFLAATEIWDWTWYWAALLFFFPAILLAIAAALDGIASVFRR